MAKKKLPKKIKNTYEDYKRKFYTAREALKAKGKVMYDNYLLSEAEWEAMNKSFENKYNREIHKGERERMPNINDVIVKQQTYEYSKAQAEVYRKRIIMEGHAIRSVEDVMLGQFDETKLDNFFDELEDEYITRMRKATAGMTKEEIKRKKIASKVKLSISQQYFGSK